MKTTRITVTTRKVSDWSGEMLCCCLFGGDTRTIQIPEELDEIFNNCPGRPQFKARPEQTMLLYSPYAVSTKTIGDGCKRLLFVGLGDQGKATGRKGKAERLEQVRLAGGRIAAECKKNSVSRIGVVMPDRDDLPELAQSLVEGILLGDYRFDKYKSDRGGSGTFSGIRKIEILVRRKLQETREMVARARVTAEAASVARDMANEPGNGWTPSSFADFATELSEEFGMGCTVLGKAQLVELGMGGILAVNQGSREEPKLIMLDYRPEVYDRTVLLVGKGLTFDSGGISLKPGKGMADMKYDMCGGAAVMATMQAIGHLKPGVRVVGVVPATDNMPGGNALKPGDIIVHYNGKTAEIDNTDAEGRLILADGLAWGIEQAGPDVVIDLATLTGAVIIGLGHHYTGLMSNDDKLAKMLIDAGNQVGEPVWQLPLGPQYAKQIESRVADVKNSGGRPGGTITAAEYLHHFVGKIPWAHLDIAGTAWDFTEKSYIPKGPSGIMVRTLLEFLLEVYPASAGKR